MDRDRELVPDSWSLVRERTARRAVDKDYNTCMLRNGHSWNCRDATCWKVLPATLCRDADKDCVMCVQEQPHLERDAAFMLESIVSNSVRRH